MTTDPQDAYESIYQEEWSRLVRLGWLMTGSRELGEDLVQDAFVKLEQRQDPIEDVRPYLRRMIVNASRDHHRRSAMQRRHSVPSEQLTFNPETAEVWELLLKIPARQRHALVLRYYADLPLEDIAALLQSPLGTVKSLIHRGLIRLREDIEQ